MADKGRSVGGRDEGEGDDGARLTERQLRLQHMISMQKAQEQASMRRFKLEEGDNNNNVAGGVGMTTTGRAVPALTSAPAPCRPPGASEAAQRKGSKEVLGSDGDGDGDGGGSSLPNVVISGGSDGGDENLPTMTTPLMMSGMAQQLSSSTVDTERESGGSSFGKWLYMGQHQESQQQHEHEQLKERESPLPQPQPQYNDGYYGQAAVGPNEGYGSTQRDSDVRGLSLTDMHLARGNPGHGPGPGLNDSINIIRHAAPAHPNEHQFHYGDPNKAYEHEFPYHPDSSGPPGLSAGGGCCPPLRRCLRSLADAENLHRSLCFGAIDGMLTGSSITAACAGLGFLTPTSSMSTRIAVAALSLSACASDGICMAIGHIWSTYVLHHGHLQELREERRNFASNRSDAKARLVDMLLGRGMLKIDAMSVADTLDGYPDIFVSALVGDLGQAPGLPRMGSHSGGPGGSWADGLGGGGALGMGVGGRPGSRGQMMTMGGGGGPGEGGGNYFQHHRPLNSNAHAYHGSYGQFDEFEDDPDLAGLHHAMKDGWIEAFIMMVSFCTFSVIPSLVMILLSKCLPSNANGGHKAHYSDRGGGVSIATVSIGLNAVVMLLLGVWKR